MLKTLKNGQNQHFCIYMEHYCDRRGNNGIGDGTVSWTAFTGWVSSMKGVAGNIQGELQGWVEKGKAGVWIMPEDQMVL